MQQKFTLISQKEKAAAYATAIILIIISKVDK